jgi:hypothetical protein
VAAADQLVRLLATGWVYKMKFDSACRPEGPRTHFFLYNFSIFPAAAGLASQAW